MSHDNVCKKCKSFPTGIDDKREYLEQLFQDDDYERDVYRKIQLAMSGGLIPNSKLIKTGFGLA